MKRSPHPCGPLWAKGVPQIVVPLGEVLPHFDRPAIRHDRGFELAERHLNEAEISKEFSGGF